MEKTKTIIKIILPVVALNLSHYFALKVFDNPQGSYMEFWNAFVSVFLLAITTLSVVFAFIILWKDESIFKSKSGGFYD